MNRLTSLNRSPEPASERANALAERLERGAETLEAIARELTAEQWSVRIPHDGRAVGVIVHHVASMYPIEMGAAKTIAAGQPVTGLTMATIDGINAEHAAKFATVTKEEAIAALRRNSAEAAAGIRELSDEELDRATSNSLYSDAPLTCQFFLEDHPVRHSYHHIARILGAIKK
jgi:hypothetical protein